MNDILSTMIRGKKRRRGVRARARALPRGLPHRPRRDGVLAVALHHRRRHGCRRDPRRRAHRFRDRRRRQPAAPEVTGEDGAASHDAGPGDPDPRRRTRPRSSDRGLVAWVVREGGVEPPRPFGHTDLNRARLPIPPLALEAGSGYPTADGRSQSGSSGVPPMSRSPVTRGMWRFRCVATGVKCRFHRVTGETNRRSPLRRGGSGAFRRTAGTLGGTDRAVCEACPPQRRDTSARRGGTR